MTEHVEVIHSTKRQCDVVIEQRSLVITPERTPERSALFSCFNFQDRGMFVENLLAHDWPLSEIEA